MLEKRGVLYDRDGLRDALQTAIRRRSSLPAMGEYLPGCTRRRAESPSLQGERLPP